MSSGTPDHVGKERESTNGLPVTQWTLVYEAAGANELQAREALGQLYNRYRKPLIGLLRCKGFPPRGQEHCLGPEDLLNGFFTHLITKEGLAKVQRDKGRFRDFLKSSLTHYAYDQRDKILAGKRGGGQVADSMDEVNPFTGETPDFAAGRSPDEEYDRAWALSLLRAAMERLEADYTSRGRGEIFKALYPNLAEKKGAGSHSEVAGRLNMSDGAVKTEVSRLRARYRDYIDEEIADTLLHPTLEAIEEEKRALFAALSNRG